MPVIILVVILVFPLVAGPLEEEVTRLFNVFSHQVTVGQFEIVFTSESIWNISGINSTQPLHHLSVPTIVEVVVGSCDVRLLPSWA